MMSHWRFKHPRQGASTKEIVEHRFHMETRTLEALVDIANEHETFPLVEIQQFGLIEVLRRAMPTEDFDHSKSSFDTRARMLHSLERAIEGLVDKGRMVMVDIAGVRIFSITTPTPAEPKIDTSLKRLAELRTMPYSEYLETPEWHSKRMRALNQANHSCQICNDNKRLNVHHRTYERRGDEYQTDLTVLCEECHKRFHGILPEEPDWGWWKP